MTAYMGIIKKPNGLVFSFELQRYQPFYTFPEALETESCVQKIAVVPYICQ